MLIEDTVVHGCHVVLHERFVDHRGSFQESYNKRSFTTKLSPEGRRLPSLFRQTNLSWSLPGVLRGLHYQEGEAPQGKLVQCLVGRVYDVCVDIRPESATFGKHAAILLDGEANYALYCPPGTAHGFYVLQGPALVMYQCTEVYHPSLDAGIRWDDPAIGIDWPFPVGVPPIVSDKDVNQPFLSHVLGMTLADLRARMGA